jgi:hypothetical protein
MELQRQRRARRKEAEIKEKSYYDPFKRHASYIEKTLKGETK